LLQVELKEAYGNAPPASFALDPPTQGQVSSFQDDRGAGGPAGADMDPADRAPSTLAVSVEPRQVAVRIADREMEALQDAGLFGFGAGGGGAVGRRGTERALRVLPGAKPSA
jgi:hypothetical protein